MIVPNKCLSIEPDGAKVNRRLIHIIANTIGHLGLCLAITSAAFAQSSRRGTFFAAATFRDYMSVAIDSRETRVSPYGIVTIDDRDCKIIPLSDDLIFFDAGVTAITNSTGQIILDSKDLAREVYRDAPHPVQIDALSERWAERMIAGYQVYASNPTINLNVQGWFAGRDNNGDLIIHGQQVGRSLFETTLRHLPDNIVVGADNTPLIYNGHLEIMAEFQGGGRTKRARNLLWEADKEAVGKPRSEKVALHLAAYVRAVRDWSGDPSIGGDVVAIIMERDQKWRWLRQPDFCPEN